MSKKRKKMSGTVKKVIKSPLPDGSEKAEIDVHEADDLYREIRIENTATTDRGEMKTFKEGESVDVIVEAETDANQKKP